MCLFLEFFHKRTTKKELLIFDVNIDKLDKIDKNKIRITYNWAYAKHLEINIIGQMCEAVILVNKEAIFWSTR